jgi:hypothetical protein
VNIAGQNPGGGCECETLKALDLLEAGAHCDFVCELLLRMRLIRDVDVWWW